MRLLEPDREADVYAISCELGLTRIGVAADARERLRAMQVGSPVPLELAATTTAAPRRPTPQRPIYAASWPTGTSAAAGTG
jgi:hypothetical protein